MAGIVYPLKLYIKNLPNRIFLLSSVLVNLCTWVWLLWHIRPQQELIFLHYNVMFGVDFIGEWWRVLFVPIAGLIILLVNGALGWFFFQKDTFMSYICNAMGLLCQVSLCVTAALLVFLNT